MSRVHFGTDGVRGIANKKLTPELAFSLGQAAGRWLTFSGFEPQAVMAMDTRQSGTMLGAAVAAGLCSSRVSVNHLGIAPTPTVSYAARSGSYGLGVIISASHNPAEDNGIKFVGHDGRKLADSVESDIEALMSAPFEERPIGGEVGKITAFTEDSNRYLDWLVSLVPEGLKGMRVVVDGANGAAYSMGPEVLRRLGADVVEIECAPDGVNINEECGATVPSLIQAKTKEFGATVGVAFDGDADRAVFSDEKGRLINGDRTIGVWAAHWQRAGKLDPAVVVGTVMSNSGFERYLESLGIQVERTPVGDKYVAARMSETGAKAGGEQSGHLIFSDYAPTGDGLLTMLQLLRVIQIEGRPLASFYDDFENWPQVLINVSVRNKDDWNQGPMVSDALNAAEKMLLGHGRTVVRASGTQPMVRVMVEADTFSLRDAAAETIMSALKAEADGKIYSKVDLTYDLGD